MERVIDDHFFTLDGPPVAAPTCCRVQVFSEARRRSIVVATQDMPPATGASLTNAAERFAQAAWDRLLPEDREPPRWIQHYTSGGAAWLEVTFELDDAGHLCSPTWGSVDLDALLDQLGSQLETDRGDRYVAPRPEPEVPTTLSIVPAWLLPATRPFRVDGCMPAQGSLLHTLRRRVFPVRGRNCCSYHGGDWRDPLRVLSRYIGGKTLIFLDEDFPAILDAVQQLAGSDPWIAEAALSLIADPIAVSAAGWENGQHRAQAAIDAGCRYLIVELC